MNHADLQQTIVDCLVEGGIWHRAVSLDIEADLNTLDDPKKPVLSVSVSNREFGEVKTRNFILDSETQDSELKLVGQLGEFCESIRPLVIIGYNLNRFDLLILSLKIRQLDRLFQTTHEYSSAYWALRETMGRSYFLDVIDPVRFAISDMDHTSPRMVSLENALQHKRFSHLPFIDSKEVATRVQKERDLGRWEAIHYLWQSDRTAFKKYITGDSHDTLLLAEDLFGVKTPRKVGDKT